MKKKLIVLILAAALCLGALSSCGKKVDKNKEIKLAAHVEGAIFGGKSDDSIPVSVIFNPDWLTVYDNTKYNAELAKLSALLSADAYFREKDLAKGSQNRVLPDGVASEDYTFTTLLEKLGFTDVEHAESYKQKKYDSDENDSVTMNLGHLTNEEYDVYAVVIRGCFSAGEWMSAFDPGILALSADSEETDVLGTIMDQGEKEPDGHPEWKNKANLKGVDVAANRAFDFVGEFVEKYDDPKKPNRILITGHSRGAAIAEILGARFENNFAFESYTYAFNSMAVTTDEDAKNYKTIFNIFDDGDLYSDFLPFGEETYYRYGKVLSKNIASSEDVLTSITALKGRDDYVSAGENARKEYAELFGKRFGGRGQLGIPMGEAAADETDEAKARLALLQELISADKGLGLEDYISLSIEENGPMAMLSVEYTNAVELLAIGKIFTYGQSAADAVKTLFSGDSGVCAIADFLVANAEAMSGGHLLVNSYALCGFLSD